MVLPLVVAVAVAAETPCARDAPAAAAPVGTAPTTSPPSPPAPPADEAGPAGFRVAALPLVSYGSDIGVQLGAVGYAYRVDRSGERADWAALALSWTSRGPSSVEVKGEALRLGGTSLRTFFQVKASLDTSAPYWGEGASLTAPGVDPGVPPGAGSPPAPYRYRAAGPWLSLVVRGDLLAPLGWWARLRTTYVSVQDPPPLLTASAPPGASGGTSSLLHLGLVHDTRDRTASPRRGILADVSLFGLPRLPPLSDWSVAGLDAGVRAYLEPWSGAVLALRALYDLKRGDVPFFERALYEGLGYGEGLGGSGTIRGLARDRLSGEEKLLAGLELRAYLLETHLLGRLQQWGLSAGGDAGAARDRGHETVGGAGAFGGARLLWDRAVTVRFEVGYAGQGSPAYYLAFDEAF